MTTLSYLLNKVAKPPETPSTKVLTKVLNFHEGESFKHEVAKIKDLSVSKYTTTFSNSDRVELFTGVFV
jgi:hypothetical protein